MADGTTLDPGSGGDTIYTDEISAGSAAGTKVQGVKLGTGANGAWTEVGDSNPVPVSDAGGSLTVDGTVTANAGTGPWPVTDNGGSLTVDGTVAVSGTAAVSAASLPLPTGAATETSVAATANAAGATTDAEASGNGSIVAVLKRLRTLLSGGLPAALGANGGLKIEGVSSGTVVPVSDGSGSLTVDNGGTFAVQDSEKVADNGAFTDGTTKLQPIGYVFDEVAGTALTENDAAAARIDSKRAQVGVLEDATTRGQRAAVSAAGRLSVDGSGVTQPVSGTVTANLAAGTNNIGDVDVLSVPAPLSTTGTGTEATALRVTVATDSTGVLSVDDNGSTLSVDDGGASLTVDYATTGSGTATGALRVELPTNGTGVIATVGAVTAITNALPTGTNAIGKLAANSGVDIGDVDVTSIAAGTNAIGNVGIVPRTTGGYSIFRSIDLDETEEEIKASAGQVFGWYIFNAAASTRFVKFYNATAANVTVGSTTPVLTIPVPAGAAANVFSETGIAFGTAITAAATTAVADADTGAPAANDVVINVFYA